MSTYEVRGEDRVETLDGLPQSSVGAPLPTVVSDEHTVVVAYLVQDSPEDRDGMTVEAVGPETEGESIALVSFPGYRAYSFGPPNDETLAGHPLADRGLGHYGCFVVEPSSWIGRLERMNSVHPRHDPARFEDLRHFILTFHDSTFECVSPSFVVEMHTGSIESAIPRMSELLRVRS